MSRTMSVAMIALSVFLTGLTAFESPAEAGRRGRNLAIGLGAAAAAAIILSETARASERRSYRRSRMSCGELADRCEDGSDWACERYYRRCD